MSRVTIICLIGLVAAVTAFDDDHEQGKNESGFDSVDGTTCYPEKVRLALTEQPGELRIGWNTHAAGCSHKVHFGLALTNPNLDQPTGDPEIDLMAGDDIAAHLNNVASSLNLDTYGPGDFCGQPATRDDFHPPNLHYAIFTDLAVGQWYEYRIGHKGPVRRFRAPPEVGPDAEFGFIVYGDMGESTHKAAKSPGAHFTAGQVTEEVLHGRTDLVIHAGDIAYADGSHKIWETFLDEIEPYASRVPYQISVGNHEYDWKTGQEKKHRSTQIDASGYKKPYQPNWGNFGNDSGGECGVTVSRLFPMSGEGPKNLLADENGHAAAPPFWFSYDYGSVHFTTLSSEHDLTEGSRQMKWLERDLSSVDRCRTPWLVIIIHRPLYVVHPHKSNRVVGDHLRKSLEDLLEDFEVDMVLSGHVHAYARTCNVYKERCITNRKGGTTHITLGCGGRKLSEVQHTQPAWLEHAERKWGFGRVIVKGRHMVFEFVHSETGKVADSVTLKVGRSAVQSCNTADSVSDDRQQDAYLARMGVADAPSQRVPETTDDLPQGQPASSPTQISQDYPSQLLRPGVEVQ